MRNPTEKGWYWVWSAADLKARPTIRWFAPAGQGYPIPEEDGWADGCRVVRAWVGPLVPPAAPPAAPPAEES